MDADLAKWQARYAEADTEGRLPSAWVIEQCRAIARDAVVLDVAAGAGRHAVPIAATGPRVIALDFVERAVHRAVQGGERVLGVVADARALPIREGTLDAIVCTYYLERAIFPVLALLLRPGGRLIVETYTLRHLELVAAGRTRGPRDPRILLAPGELPRLVAPLRVVASREGLVEDAHGARHTAGVMAVRT